MKTIFIFVLVILSKTTLCQSLPKKFDITIEVKDKYSLSSIEIVMSGSEVGVDYQLIKIDAAKKRIPWGAPIKGTGKKIVFYPQCLGKFDIQASIPGYTVIMPDNVDIWINSEKNSKRSFQVILLYCSVVVGSIVVLWLFRRVWNVF